MAGATYTTEGRLPLSLPKGIPRRLLRGGDNCGIHSETFLKPRRERKGDGGGGTTMHQKCRRQWTGGIRSVRHEENGDGRVRSGEGLGDLVGYGEG